MLGRAIIVLLILCVIGARCSAQDGYPALVASSHVRRDVTVSLVVKAEAFKYVGAVVEWRGMASDLTGDEEHSRFVLHVGPYDVKVSGTGIPTTFEEGSAVRILGRLTAGGKAPALKLMGVAPPPPQATQEVWNPYIVTPRQAAMVSEWYQWILTFNRRLAPNTAGLYASTIFKHSRLDGIDPRLVLSVVAAESAFQADAVSPVGAIGLGQLMPDTAHRLGVKDIHDPVQNLQGCCHLLSQEYQHWKLSPDRLSRVLASYNAGEGAVEQYGGIPPYAETINYVRYVLALYRELGGPAETAAP